MYSQYSTLKVTKPDVQPKDKPIPSVTTVINPTLGNVLQGVTSPKEAIAEIVKSDVSLDDKIKLQQLIYEQQNKEIEAITSRWNADSLSDSWLSKNVRPLVSVSYTHLTLPTNREV